MADDILVALRSEMFDFDGRRVLVSAGRTTVRAGHPLLTGHGDLFGPLVPDYEVGDDEPQSAVSEQFDPSAHKIEDVLAYLDGKDEAEVERVLAAERDGKNRSTLLDQFDQFEDEGDAQ